ncbi:ANR family transcriptional regulator [Vibrio rotiferianus]|uniref:ANR family transcriptional regulator n=1 Tax=Vibrio rotiferianus TaxID=190895 RepID=UPI00390BA583
MNTIQVNYLELAQKACESERESHWFQASEYWRAAFNVAATTANQNWAVCRAEYCRARAGMRLSVKREQNESF